MGCSCCSCSSSIGKQSQLLLKPTEVELGLQVVVKFDNNPHLGFSRRSDPTFSKFLVGVRKVFGRYPDGFWRVFGMCQKGDWKESGQCLEVIWNRDGILAEN